MKYSLRLSFSGCIRALANTEMSSWNSAIIYLESSYICYHLFFTMAYLPWTFLMTSGFHVTSSFLIDFCFFHVFACCFSKGHSSNGILLLLVLKSVECHRCSPWIRKRLDTTHSNVYSGLLLIIAKICWFFLLIRVITFKCSITCEKKWQCPPPSSSLVLNWPLGFWGIQFCQSKRFSTLFKT